jgi:hypothetical protein
VQEGKQVLYIEHIAASPGDLDTELWGRRYSHVGFALLAYAILWSRQQGFAGRLGLHVADAGVLGFYRSLSQNHCGGKLWHPERRGVLAPTPYSTMETDGERVYLESTEDASTTWLEEYRRG